jgi:hypothetical protein
VRMSAGALVRMAVVSVVPVAVAAVRV